MEKNKAFEELLEQVSGGSALFGGLVKEDLEALALAKNEAELAELARARGFAFNDRELTELGRVLLNRPRGGELTEDDLINIAGGFPISKVLPEAAINELALVKDDQGLDELLARYDVDLADEDREKLVRGIKIKKKRETLI